VSRRALRCPRDIGKRKRCFGSRSFGFSAREEGRGVSEAGVSDFRLEKSEEEFRKPEFRIFGKRRGKRSFGSRSFGFSAREEGRGVSEAGVSDFRLEKSEEEFRKPEFRILG
jgi:hypothetical protein